MARSKGTARFAVNFEPTGQTPLDARLLVPTLEDLYTAYADDSNYYQDMVVTVQEDHSQYILIDVAQRTSAAGWKRIDAGAAELDGSHVELSDSYTQAGSFTAPAAGDTLDEAIGKLAAGVADVSTKAGVTSLNEQTGAITITEGDENGQIKVGTENINVHGLGSAAYTDSTDYDAAGSADAAKSAVIGTSSDASSVDTINGAKKYADEKVAAIDLPTVVAGDGIEVSGSSDYTVAVKVADDTIVVDENGVKVASGKFDAAGAANGIKTELLGDSADTSSDNTIYGVKKYAEEKATAAAEASKVTVVNDLTTGGTDAALSAEQGKVLKGQVDAKVASVGAGNGIEIGGTATNPTVAIKINETPGNVVLTADENGLKAEVDIPSVSVPIQSVAAGDKVLALTGTTLSTTIGLKYVSESKKIQLTGIDSEVIAEIDATTFIKDGMVQNVSFDPESKKLTITFNTDAGEEPIEVDLTSLVDTYTASNGINISGNAISVVVDPASESFLTVGSTGVKLAGVQDAIDAAKTEVVGTDDDQSSVDTVKGSKKYTDEKIATVTNIVNQRVKKYVGTATSGTEVTFQAATHGCGTTPMVQCFNGGSAVGCAVEVDASGNVTVSWNGSIVTAESPLTVVILGF